MRKAKIIGIVGPTGVGKTVLAMKVAERLKTEIISCDSMQIYRFLDIGTGKPTIEEQKRCRHHMMDVVDPDKNFNAASYTEQSEKIVQEFVANGRIPLVVGGTGLYLRALLDGLIDHPIIPKESKQELEEKWSGYPSIDIHQRLSKVDEVAATKIHPNDRKRLLRALEVFEYTGIPISEFHRTQTYEEKYTPLLFGLKLDRKPLYDKINQRVEKMFQNGWVEEVKMLREKGYSPKLLSMQSLGYKYINQFLDGRINPEEMIRFTQRDTRHYAKRQETWFRAEPRVQWLDMEQHDLDSATKFIIQSSQAKL